MTPNDTYFVEFRCKHYAAPNGLTAWITIGVETPTSMSDVITLIRTYHEAAISGKNHTDAQGGLFRCRCLPEDTGSWRWVTDEALEAYGRWCLVMDDEWPWWVDKPADVAEMENEPDHEGQERHGWEQV